MGIRKKVKNPAKGYFIIALIFLISLIFFSYSGYSQVHWLSIEEITVNQGRTNEVATGQNLSVEITINSFGAPANTNATIGINIKYPNGTIAESFANQSRVIPKGQSTNVTGFVKTITTSQTGEYFLEAFVVYEKNGTNDTIYKNKTIKIISVSPLMLEIKHEDAAAGEIATFKQWFKNNGSIDANTTTKVWIYFDKNLDGHYKDADGDYIDATEPPVSATIANNSNGSVALAWDVPSFSGCDYIDPAKYIVYSVVAYGALDVSSGIHGGLLSPFNISSVFVGEDCAGYCESGLYQTEIAPGGTVSGRIRLKNDDINKSVIIHEVRAWVEDESGNKIVDLSPTDNSLNIAGKAYIDNKIPKSNESTCSDLANNKDYAYKDFNFAGTLPGSLNISTSYKVVFAYDYGVPRSDIAGNPWNEEKAYNFNLVVLNVTNLSAKEEVTYGALQNITAKIANIGPNQITSAGVYFSIKDSASNEIKNSTTVINLSVGEEKSISYTFTPTALEFSEGEYTIEAKATYGGGASSKLTKSFRIVYLATLSDNITATDVAPYEFANITIPIENQGNTNATMNELNVSINATPNPTVASIKNTIIENNSIYYFNISYYFDPANFTNITNRSYGITLKETYGSLSFSLNPNATIKFLPAGIKSFSVPSIAINGSPFIVSTIIKNIANSSMPITLNLSANGTTLNITTITLAQNSETKVNFNITLNQNGSYTIELRANYSGLPQDIVRRESTNIYLSGADLKIESISYSPSTVNPGTNTTISVNISNTGAINASNFVVGLLVNNASLENKTLSLNAGNSSILKFYFVPNATGNYNITAIADRNNAVIESNETNNNKTITIKVTSPPSKAPSGGGAGGGAGYYTGANIGIRVDTLEGAIKISETDLYDLILYYGLEGRQFYIAPQELFGVIGSADSLPVKSDIAERIKKIARKGILNLSGDNYKAAADIVKQAFPTARKIIIARGDLGFDSVAAISYARALGMPIMITEPSRLGDEAKDIISKLFVKETIVIGGEEAISNNVFSSLPNPRRIGGRDRYETAVMLAEEIIKARGENLADTIIITNGEELSEDVIPFVLRYKAPVIYTRGEEIPEITKEFLRRHRFKRVIVVSTPASASEIEKLAGY